MVPELDTRQRILDVATEFFVVGGISGLSMRKIAGEVGVSATAIYRHFDSKESLVVAVSREGFRRFAEYLWRALDAGSPLARLREAGRQYARFAIEHDRYYRVMFMTPCDELGYGAVTEHTAESVAPTFQFLVDRVRECVDAGALIAADPPSLSATIWAHLHGHVALYLLDHMARAVPNDEDFYAFLEDSTGRLFDGLRPRR